MADGYIHSFSAEEQARLVAQAEFLEPYIFPTIEFPGCARVLEVGCGVGAELQILRRRFPQAKLTGLDYSAAQLAKARELLHADLATGQIELRQGSAYELPFDSGEFDGVCLVWVLEHLARPERALREANRVLRPGGWFSVTEVYNASWETHPPCPAMADYWRAFNELQRDLGGQPDVGSELGELAAQADFCEIQFRTLPVRMDATMEAPAARRRFINYWQSLWLSGAAQLRERKKIPHALVEAIQIEFAGLANNPEGVFHYTACQVSARTPTA